MTSTNIPIACELSLKEQEDERRTLKRDFFPNVQELRELKNGYRLRFDWSSSRIVELGNFVAFESNCCPFIHFDIHVKPGRTAVWLELSGPGETKAVLHDELQAMLPDHFLNLPAVRNKGSMLSGAGISLAGILALMCCATPLLTLVGLTAGATALGSIFDVGTTVAIVGGIVLLSVALHRRRQIVRALAQINPD